MHYDYILEKGVIFLDVLFFSFFLFYQVLFFLRLQNEKMHALFSPYVCPVSSGFKIRNGCDSF